MLHDLNNNSLKIPVFSSVTVDNKSDWYFSVAASDVILAGFHSHVTLVAFSLK